MPEVPEVTNRIEHLLEQIELATGQEPLSEARRASWRYTWAAHVAIEFVDPNDSSDPLHVTTRTIFAHGLDFRSPRILERGCKVLITLQTDEGELQIPATVMHSTTSVGMPIVGVKFDLEKDLS